MPSVPLPPGKPMCLASNKGKHQKLARKKRERYQEQTDGRGQGSQQIGVQSVERRRPAHQERSPPKCSPPLSTGVGGTNAESSVAGDIAVRRTSQQVSLRILGKLKLAEQGGTPRGCERKRTGNLWVQLSVSLPHGSPRPWKFAECGANPCGCGWMDAMPQPTASSKQGRWGSHGSRRNQWG